MRGRYRNFPYIDTSCLHTGITSSIINFTHQNGLFFFFYLKMNLRGYIIVTQRPQFTLEFTLGVVHSVGLDRCLMTRTHHYRGFPGSSVVKNPLPRQEMWVQSVDWEDPLEEEMATHSRILDWKIAWTEEPGGLQCAGLRKSRARLRTAPLPSLWCHPECFHRPKHCQRCVSLTTHPWQPLIFSLFPQFCLLRIM